MSPQTRGLVPPDRAAAMAQARAERDQAQERFEKSVAAALKAGGSVREVATASGLAKQTVEVYGRRHGWPTPAQRRAWDAKAEAGRQWHEAMRPARSRDDRQHR